MTQSGKEVLVGLRSWILRSISGQAADTYPSAAPAQPVGPGPSLGQQLGPEQQFLYAEELNNQGRPELALAVLNRVELKARASESLLHGLRERVAIDPGQQFEMHAMPWEPTFFQQSGRLHARRRDEHAR